MTIEPRDVQNLLNSPEALAAFRSLVLPARMGEPRNKREFARSSNGRQRRNERRAVRYAKSSFINL